MLLYSIELNVRSGNIIMFKNNKGKNKSDIPEAEYTNTSNRDADNGDFINNSDFLKNAGFIEKTDFLKNTGFLEKTDFTENAGLTEKTDFSENTGFTEKTDFTENPGFLKDADYIENAAPAGNSRLSGGLTSAEAAAIAEALITFKAPAESKPPAAQNPPSDAVPVNDPIDEAIAHNTITGELLIPYTRQAMYYETDQMGVIHHSNYIRWFEESRVYFLEQIGLNYDKSLSLTVLR